MGSRLLNGSLQLSVRVTMFPLILIVLISIVTLGTTSGMPAHKIMYVLQLLHTYVHMITTYNITDIQIAMFNDL